MNKEQARVPAKIWVDPKDMTVKKEHTEGCIGYVAQAAVSKMLLDMWKDELQYVGLTRKMKQYAKRLLLYLAQWIMKI